MPWLHSRWRRRGRSLRSRPCLCRSFATTGPEADSFERSDSWTWWAAKQEKATAARCLTLLSFVAGCGTTEVTARPDAVFARISLPCELWSRRSRATFHLGQEQARRPARPLPAIGQAVPTAGDVVENPKRGAARCACLASCGFRCQPPAMTLVGHRPQAPTRGY